MENIFTKIAWRLIPFMGLLYVVNFLDRVNVGFAALTMNRDLGLGAEAFGVGAGIFFLGYFFFEVPSNVILERVGARLWIFRIMFTWGLVSMATAFAQGPWSFYGLRFLLGVAEAGFFPGMMLYLTYWFPQSERAKYNSLFFAAIPLSSALGSPLSGYILGFEGLAGLHGWQWLFLIEGMPSCVLAFAVLFFLPNGPATAKFLDNDEKALRAEPACARCAAARKPVERARRLARLGARDNRHRNHHRALWSGSVAAADREGNGIRQFSDRPCRCHSLCRQHHRNASVGAIERHVARKGLACGDTRTVRKREPRRCGVILAQICGHCWRSPAPPRESMQPSSPTGRCRPPSWAGRLRRAVSPSSIPSAIWAGSSDPH